MTSSQETKVRKYLELYQGYSLTITPELRDTNLNDQEVYAILQRKDGKRFRGVFVSFDYMKKLNDHHRIIGEFANGSYLFIQGMIPAPVVNSRVIRLTVDDLIQKLIFHKAFQNF